MTFQRILCSYCCCWKAAEDEEEKRMQNLFGAGSCCCSVLLCKTFRFPQKSESFRKWAERKLIAQNRRSRRRLMPIFLWAPVFSLLRFPRFRPLFNLRNRGSRWTITRRKEMKEGGTEQRIQRRSKSTAFFVYTSRKLSRYTSRAVFLSGVPSIFSCIFHRYERLRCEKEKLRGANFHAAFFLASLS